MTSVPIIRGDWDTEAHRGLTLTLRGNSDGVAGGVPAVHMDDLDYAFGSYLGLTQP